MSAWDIEVRPHLTPYFAYGAAALILFAHIAVGALLKISSTGVIFQTADQVAIALLGAVIAGAVLLFARPRLRVGAPRVPWDCPGHAGRAVRLRRDHRGGVPQPAGSPARHRQMTTEVAGPSGH